MGIREWFKIKDLDGDDEFDDDLLDDDEDDDDEDDDFDDDDDDYVASSRNKSKYKASSSKSYDTYNQKNNNTYKNNSYTQRNNKTENVVDFSKTTRSNAPRSLNGSSLYVIKPHDFSESQTVAQHLKTGRAIVINMEGIELDAAQRIIDFIGGACYALEGSLQAISGSIFVAAPSNIAVSGDLRTEIINENTVSPNLTNGY